MGVLEIRKFDDPVLRQKARPVRRVNAAVRKTLDEMAETLCAAKGAGLAAPQIGIDRALVVIDVGEGLIELVNPKIVSSEGSVTAVEGCLSLPGMFGEVPRAEKVKVEALDGNGHRTWVEGEGLLARALQHELDHLDGVLFIDKATSITIEEGDEDEPKNPDAAGAAGDAGEASRPGTKD